jgi:hypothetical protein
MPIYSPLPAYTAAARYASLHVRDATVEYVTAGQKPVGGLLAA